MRKFHLCAVVLGLLTSLSASAATITVFVGYADNLRPSGFFPTPWLGDSGVVSQTPTGQSLDAGAVRISNPTGSAVTISDLTVALGGGQVFALWAPLVIPAGGNGIFTQTSSYNFDSSDFGLFGGAPVNVDATHPLGGCTNPANAGQAMQCAAFQPIVSFKVDGNPITLKDSGHILDTFGYDLINLPPPGGDGNESINWNVIGSIPTRGGTVPEPSSMLLVASALGGAVLLRRHAVKRARRSMS